MKTSAVRESTTVLGSGTGARA